jgi:hypothetical protein
MMCTMHLLTLNVLPCSKMITGPSQLAIDQVDNHLLQALRSLATRWF